MTPEEAVIGACLLDQNVIREAVKFVMPSDFSHWKGEEIFSAIIALHATKQPVDVITVGAKLLQDGSKVHPAELHRLIEQVPSAANVAFYAEQVREASVRRSLRAVGLKIVQETENEAIKPGVTLAEGLAALKHVRDDASVSALQGKILDDVMGAKDEYEWVIRNFLEAGDRLILTADEGSGKSMLAFQTAVLAAAGIHPFYLHDIDPVNVVVFDRENSERRWRRKARPIFNAAKAAGKGDPGQVYIENAIYRGFDITTDRDLGYLHRILDSHPCQLLIIGPLYRLVPRAINSDDEAAPLLAALDSLRERGCAIFTEAHAGHARSADLHPVGSSAFLRWPEFGIGLRKDPEVPGRVTLERWRGDREERAFPLAMNRGAGSVPWVIEGVSPALLARINNPQSAFWEGQ